MISNSNIFFLDMGYPDSTTTFLLSTLKLTVVGYTKRQTFIWLFKSSLTFCVLGYVYPDKDVQRFLDETRETFPVNLLYNEGLTAFKEFLCDTPGERNLLLWLELESCKGFNEVEQNRFVGKCFLKN